VAVHVRAEGVPAEVVGTLTAVDAVVDAATRNQQAQAKLANPEGKLRPGMFVNARVDLGASSSVVAVPASAISYAPYGDSVFVVEELKGEKGMPYKGVTQKFVKLGSGRGDLVAVLSGLAPGAEVVTSGAFKLRSGAAVLVNNDVQPASSANPKPENS
jgi:membrane fusion protein (multidrug efflux system)